MKSFTAPKYKNINNLKLSYYEVGKGIPVFCFPGWPASGTMYKPLIDKLGNAGKFITVDIPGWAGESDDFDKNPNPRSLAELFKKFIKSFKFKEFNLIGYSYGGIICQQLIDLGAKPKKLVLISTTHTALDAKNEPFIKRVLQIYTQSRNKLSDKAVDNAVVAATIAGMSQGAKYRHKRPSQTLKAAHSLIYPDATQAASSLFALIDADWLPKSFGKTEVMVIYSTSEHKFIGKGSREIAKHAGVRPHVIKNAYHAHLVFEPEKTAPLIKKFLLQ